MSRDRDRSKETTTPVRLPRTLIDDAKEATGLPAGPAVRETVRRGLRPDVLLDMMEREPMCDLVVVDEHQGDCLCGKCPALGRLTARQLAALWRAGDPAAETYMGVAATYALLWMCSQVKAEEARREKEAPCSPA